MPRRKVAEVGAKFIILLTLTNFEWFLVDSSVPEE